MMPLREIANRPRRPAPGPRIPHKRRPAAADNSEGGAGVKVRVAGVAFGRQCADASRVHRTVRGLPSPGQLFGGQSMAVQERGSDERQLVVFRLANDVYGIEIQAVREIIRIHDVTRVPNAPEFIEGVINLRGRICPVMDLRRRFGVDVADASSESRIVVVEIQGEDVGMIVDAVTEVLRVSGERVQPPSSVVTSAGTRVVEGIVNLGDRLIMLVDLDTLLSAEDRAAVVSMETLAAA